jgi:HD-like signal output (HDOD) protein/ActR/RegA family two-component response regulator
MTAVDPELPMMRLLFVDDDERLLRALQQCLRGQRRAWEMRFAATADEAISILSEWTCDLVLTDMRMPGMNGNELLKRVRWSQPSALRIVLSGQMDDSAAAQTATLAHRFLAKPIETEQLVFVLRQSLLLRERFQSDQMRQCLGGLASLPSLPASCAALNHALRDDKASMGEVAGIIEGDPAMTAKVLQLVNSSFFGLSRECIGIQQAIRYLGMNAVRSLVLANALFEQLAGGNHEALQAEQERSLMVARMARRFALPQRQGDVAATAAMLHNAGELAFISQLPEEYEANRAHASLHGVSVDEAARARLGVTHAEVGAYLLSLWGLPLQVVEAVAAQDTPPEVLDPGAVLWFAKALSREAEQGETGNEAVVDQAALRAGVGDVVEMLRDEIALSQFDRRAS